VNHFGAKGGKLNQSLKVLLRARALPIVALALASAEGRAAQHDAAEYAQLLAQAQAEGAVRVMAVLDVDVGLQDDSLRRALIATVIPRKTQALLQELGDAVWSAGYWTNGLGQLGLYVTPDGLRYLANSGNARSFTRDATDRMRTRLPNAAGQLTAIERDLFARGWSDVELTLNLESLDFDVGLDRAVRFRAVNALEAAEMRSRLLGVLNERQALDLADARRAAVSASPQVRLRLTREGYALLRDHGLARSLRPVGFIDARPADFASSALDHAKTHGSAEVLIELRGGDVFSPAQGHLPARAWNNQLESMRRAFREILGPGIAEGVLQQQDFSEVRSLVARMSHAALASLYANADPRVLRVRLNEPVATGGLATSTVITNMTQAWAAGHRAAGQTLVVIDSGVKKSHEFFRMNGASKVTYEFCAGTNSGSYRSICPAANGLGDSPPNYPGSGEPQSLASCPTGSINFAQCSHGTHVAGIAAGRASAQLPAGLQGMAPDANIVAAQVFSFDPANAQAPAVFRDDFLAALQTLYNSTTTDAFTANISLQWPASGAFTSDCAGYDGAVEDYVALLNSRNIAVVTINGNQSSQEGVYWPGCTPGTIKAGATNNSGTGNVMNAYSNWGDPAAFSGAMLLAPGFYVTSSGTASTTSTVSMGGTSMAAPHIAGYYAAIKAATPGITVANATAWILATGSVPASAHGYTYRRIKAQGF
jgi:subtilisin family serine protease